MRACETLQFPRAPFVKVTHQDYQLDLLRHSTLACNSLQAEVGHER